MTRAEATAAVRGRLVGAAIEQLADHGMRGLTHRRVEQRAELAQGSAKYHFGSIGGLIEAVLERMVEVELASVMVAPPELLAEAAATGKVPDEVWRQARAVCADVLARPTLLRARFELYLHAVGRPELQAIIRRGRDRFVARTAAALTGAAGSTGNAAPGPESSCDALAAAELGARMVLAFVDGMVLHQLSAPEESGESGELEQSARSGAADRMAQQLVAVAAAAHQLSVVPADLSATADLDGAG